MYCEDLMIEAHSCVDVEKRKQLMENAFFANLGLTNILLRKYGMSEKNHDDYLQLAYIAFDKTVRSYKEGGHYSLLSYYRLNVKHECYVCWLQEKKYKLEDMEDVNTEEVANVSYNSMNEFTGGIEDEFMNKLLWERVTSDLNDKNVAIVHRRFVQEQTLQCIGSNYGISAERVRQRLAQSCMVLREDSLVREVARHYHFL